MLKFVVNYSMCGYLLNLEINPAGEKFDFDQAFQKIKYRGPDFTKVDISTLSDNKLTYGHHRLAIIDLKQESNQPFNSDCGQFTILFNGEIFNYKELRDKYLDSYDFNTNSDTEVLLQLYMKYREAMLPWLDGFFSFVIIDRVQNEVFGCVDPFGVKPMFIECNDRYLRVGSELSCLRSRKFFGSEVSPTALRDFFRYSHIPAPRSIIKSIRKAEQGSFFVFDNSIGTLKFHKYFDILDLKNIKKKLNIGDFSRAVLSRSVADVEMVAFLSSGVDSAFVTSLMPNKHQLTTFTSGIDDQLLDESLGASNSAKKLNVKNVNIKSKFDKSSSIAEVFSHLDEPFGDSSVILVDRLSYVIREAGYNVAISSDGGDEIFYGYRRHRLFFFVKKFVILRNVLKFLIVCLNRNKFLIALLSKKIPLLSLKIGKLEKFLSDEKLKYLDLLKTFSDSDLSKLFCATQIEHLDARPKNYDKDSEVLEIIEMLPLWKQVKYLDYKVYLPQILFKLDRCGMRNSIEIREPLLQKNLVTKSFQQEMTWTDFLFPKHFMRSALLSSNNLRIEKKKRGFSVSQEFLLNLFKGELPNILLSSSDKHQLLNNEYISEIYEEYKADGLNVDKVWLLLVWHIWKKENIL